MTDQGFEYEVEALLLAAYNRGQADERVACGRVRELAVRLARTGHAIAMHQPAVTSRSQGEATMWGMFYDTVNEMMRALAEPAEPVGQKDGG